MAGKGKKMAAKAATLLLVSSMAFGTLTGCGVSVKFAEVKSKDSIANQTAEQSVDRTLKNEDIIAEVSGYDVIVDNFAGSGIVFSKFYFYFTDDKGQVYYTKVGAETDAHLILRNSIGKKVNLNKVSEEFSQVKKIIVPEGLFVSEKSEAKTVSRSQDEVFFSSVNRLQKTR